MKTNNKMDFVELGNDNLYVFDQIIKKMNIYQFDFLLAFFGFYIVRYTFPNLVLEKDQNLKTGFTLAFCYALLGFIRSQILKYKNDIDEN